MNTALLGASRLTFGSLVKLTFDGNSLVQGVGASGSSTNIVGRTMGAAPLAGSGATSVNRGISGQSWAAMDSAATDVDGSFVDGKTNLLVLWETTNSIFNDRSGVDQTIADLQAYVANRKAAHADWRFVFMTTLPRHSGLDLTTRNALNAQLNQVDSWLRGNYRAIGGHGLVDVRPSNSPFALSGYTDADFATANAFWNETDAPIHLNDAGYALVGPWVASEVARLKLRP